MICVEVEVAGDELVIRGASGGAREWWGEASGLVSDGALLRDLLHADEWYVLEELRDSLQKAITTPSTAAWLSRAEFNVAVCCKRGGSKKRKRAGPTTYAQAKVQVATYSESDIARARTEPGGVPDSAASIGRAVVIFTPLEQPCGQTD
jgi:hypothetical protein